MTKLSSRVALSVAVLSYCFVPEVCTAESPAVQASEGSQQRTSPNVEKARRHFSQGVQFYNAGDYKLSLIEFRRSYELSKNYRILYNIGQVNQQLGNYTNALNALEEYLRKSEGDVGDERRAEVLASILMLRTRVAHVKLVTNVDAPEVLVDGFPVDVKSTNGEIALDPGDHRIDLRKPGYESGGTVVALAAGDANRLRIDLRPVPTSTRTIARVHAQPTHRDSTWLWVGWSTTAATALGAGITGVLALTQANELANLRNSSGSTQSQRDEVGGRAKAFALASDALTIAALAAGATSLYLTFRSEKPARERAPVPAARLGLTAGGVSFEQTF